MARPKRVIDATTCAQVAALRAEGLGQKAIGRALGMSSDAVRDVLKLPQTQADFAQARLMIRLRTLEHLGEITDGAWAVVKDRLARGDAKGFADAVGNVERLTRIFASIEAEQDRTETPRDAPAAPGDEHGCGVRPAQADSRQR